MQPFQPISFTAEWGSFNCRTALEFYRSCIVQLEYYLNRGISPDPEFTRMDLRGYRQLVDLGCEQTALRFLRLRSEMNEYSYSRPGTLVVINELKRRGEWGSNVSTK